MPIINPLFWANRNGIPRLLAENVSITDTNVTYNFNGNLFRVIPFSGLILFKLPAYTAPATAVPVIFNTGGNNAINVTTLGGTAVTSAELNQAGIYLAYFENNTLLLLTGI